MDRRASHEIDEVVAVVGHHDQFLVEKLEEELRVFETRPATMDHVIRFVSCGVRCRAQVRAQAFVDQKPHVRSNARSRPRCARGRASVGRGEGASLRT
jgi:hypothetical protein